MNDLAISGLVIAYGGLLAVDGLDLAVAAGESVALLGPSGSGKSSVLRAVAGYLAPRSGTIRIGGRDVTRAPARDRNCGMVFQDYALFPHLTVFDNIAFGLRARRVPKAEIRDRVEQVLATVDLPDLSERYPRELSGGQQQRVALARAIVVRPAVLLMDEPMGALDVKLREAMQLYVRRIQRQLRITTVYVTHDPAEAYAMADHIVVMRRGRIAAAGRTHEVYTEPPNAFAARFLTSCTLLELVLPADGSRLWPSGLPGHERPLRLARPLQAGTHRAFVVLKPEAIRCAARPSPGSSPGVVAARRVAGPSFLVAVAVGDVTFMALDPSGRFSEGDAAHVAWHPEETRVIEESGDGHPSTAPDQRLEAAGARAGAEIGGG
jgi:putative spermidine/putrescine transport system ATP-binding protein